MSSDMLRVIVDQGDGFTSYMCADAALDVRADGGLSLYIAGRQIDFTRPERLLELAILLNYAPVVSALHVLAAKQSGAPTRQRRRDRNR